ncbi:MAG: hypothetical protein H0W76_21435 [Pyrinomonadaceae bacterium]|nr:hypothetical protein [Pyrinomonadaceae bacterium]
MKTEKRKYRGIEDLYEAEDELRIEREHHRMTAISQPISNSLTNLSSLPESNSLPENNSLSIVSSLPSGDEQAYQHNRLPELNRLPSSSNPDESKRPEDEALNLMASLPEVNGYMKFWHQLTDHLYQHLTPSEQVVHLQLYRLSWGHGKSTCEIGLPRLAARAGIGRSTAQQAVNGLVKKGLVKKLKMIIGSNKEQGIEYHVEPTSSQVKSGRLMESNSLPKPGSLPKSTPNKENTQKENTQTQPAPAAGVRVGSKFSIEECRKYAKHLQSTGQGITNPGGYATTIHRTGEADLLIDSFLHPESANTSATLDTSQCPDCQGTGFYYPQGIEAGVARCKHDQLRKEGK